MAKQTKEREDCGCTFSETTGEKATETAVSGGVGGAYGAAAGFLVGSFVPVVGNAVRGLRRSATADPVVADLVSQ